MNKEKYFKCVCGSEILLIDSTYFKLEDEVYLAMYDHYPENKSIKERLRCCWHILKTGNLFTDCIILHRTQIEEIFNHLKELIKERK